MPWVDKDDCVGCGVCVNICPEGFELRDGIATVKNPKAYCIGEAISTCPVEAIHTDEKSGSKVGYQPSSTSRSRGMGMGRGAGRGLGIGPRDGRGRGRGGGGRRR
ncbi:MAG: ferredoxin [Thermoplasmata archaeon]|nr:ferredoxin [Thermoplasmata archaeon]